MFLHTATLFLFLAHLTTPFDPFIMSHCSIYPSRIYVPPSYSSSLQTRNWSASARSTVADCAFACFDTNLCKTALFDAGPSTCVMFSDAAASTGQLVAAPSSEFTTIAIENLRRKSSAESVDWETCRECSFCFLNRSSDIGRGFLWRVCHMEYHGGWK